MLTIHLWNQALNFVYRCTSITAIRFHRLQSFNNTKCSWTCISNGKGSNSLVVPIWFSLKLHDNLLGISWRHLIDQLWELLLTCDSSHDLAVKFNKENKLKMHFCVKIYKYTHRKETKHLAKPKAIIMVLLCGVIETIPKEWTNLACNILSSMKVIAYVSIPVFKGKQRTRPEGTMIHHRFL